MPDAGTNKTLIDLRHTKPHLPLSIAFLVANPDALGRDPKTFFKVGRKVVVLLDPSTGDIVQLHEKED